MPQPLPMSSAVAQGVDPAAIRALVEAWEAGGTRPFALTVVRHGHVVAQATWSPYGPDDAVLKYSLSKTFTACAVGLAVGEGRLAVTDRLVDLWPEATGVGPRAAALTVGHLLAMATGHATDTLDRLDPADGPGSFLRLEPDAEPGTLFCYNNGAPVMLSAIVQQVTGEPLHAYLRPRLFDPLGIGAAHWLAPAGVDEGFSGLHVSNDAVARLGLLLLDRGAVAGRRVLAPEWVDQMTTVHVANGSDPASDWEQGYGYQMWRSRHGWRGDGAYGQLCLVLPEHDLVLAASAQTPDMQAELAAVWELLLPGLHDEPLGGGDDGLVDFLAGRTLPTIASSAPATPGRHELRAEGPAAARVAPGGGVVLRDGTLVVDDGTGAVLVPLGDGHWARSSTTLADGTEVAVAGTAGWTDPGRLEARVVALHSPHVLEVSADVGAGTAVLRWQTEPLGDTTLARTTR